LKSVSTSLAPEISLDRRLALLRRCGRAWSSTDTECILRAMLAATAATAATAIAATATATAEPAAALPGRLLQTIFSICARRRTRGTRAIVGTLADICERALGDDDRSESRSLAPQCVAPTSRLPEVRLRARARAFTIFYFRALRIATDAVVWLTSWCRAGT
jgi:hypothetical protein